MAIDGPFSEHRAKITLVSLLRHSSAPIDVWLLERLSTKQFVIDIETFMQSHGGRCHFLKYKWPNWLPSVSHAEQAASVSRFLFLDFIMPLSVQRVIGLIPGMLVLGDIADLMWMEMGEIACALLPYIGNVAKNSRPFYRGDFFVVELPIWRRAYVGGSIRESYQRMITNPRNAEWIDTLLASTLQTRVGVMTLPSPWEWCAIGMDEADLPRAKLVTACPSPGWENFKYLRANVSVWREAEQELLSVMKSR
jgi:UDP-glucose:glycoprotein glucosyltransferase